MSAGAPERRAARVFSEGARFARAAAQFPQAAIIAFLACSRIESASESG